MVDDGQNGCGISVYLVVCRSAARSSFVFRVLAMPWHSKGYAGSNWKMIAMSKYSTGKDFGKIII